jgi:hypothetical protein
VLSGKGFQETRIGKLLCGLVTYHGAVQCQHRQTHILSCNSDLLQCFLQCMRRAKLCFLRITSETPNQFATICWCSYKVEIRLFGTSCTCYWKSPDKSRSQQVASSWNALMNRPGSRFQFCNFPYLHTKAGSAI